MKSYRVSRIPIIALLFLAMTAVALPWSSHSQQQKRAEFMIRNLSDWSIYHLYLSPEKKDSWGPDQLGDQVITPAESFTLKGIPCGKYDMKIVDEDGDACVVEGILMCKDHTHCDLTNKELAKCQTESG